MNRLIPDTIIRNGIYQFKKRVPERLADSQAFGGKRFIQKSLRTRDPREARQLAADLDAQFQNLCGLAERELSPSISFKGTFNVLKARAPTEVEVQAEVLRLKNGYLARTHRGHDTVNTIAFGQHNQEIYSGSPDYVWHDRLESLEGAFRGQPDLGTLVAVDRIIKENGWKVETDSSLHDELCRRIAAAQIEAIEKLFQSERGDFHDQFKVAGPASAKTLLDALEHYQRLKGSRTQMLKKVTVAVRAWDDLVGKLLISSIDRGDIREFIADLSRVPMRLRAKNPNASLRDLINHARSNASGETRLEARTIKDNYLSPLSTAVNALREDFPEISNPFEGIKVDGASRKSNKRSFKDHELQAMFRHPIFTGCKSKTRRNTPGDQIIRDHYLWAPIIALWTGMRANEIATLEVEDVRLSELGYAGKPHFRIKAGKTDNAKREVPIHPKLIELGFADYVAKIASAGHKRVFPDWKQPKGKLYSSGASQKNFNTHVVSCCDDDNVSFHTFRHTMKNAMAKARIPEQYQRAILGHEKLDRDADYFHPELDHYFDEFVNKVDFPDVDLSHLSA